MHDSLVAAVVAASWPPQLHIITGHLDVGGGLKQICVAAAAEHRFSDTVTVNRQVGGSLKQICAAAAAAADHNSKTT
jgi:hypothetical protein